MNDFDQRILFHLCHFANHSWQFDYAVFSISNNELLKGGFFMALVWFAWFRGDEEKGKPQVLITLLGALLALAADKAIEHFAPFRLRPYHSHLEGIHFPFDMGMRHESSFPSDHATLFFALAFGFLFISRVLGWSALLYALFVIVLPRLYLGLHFPSDILAGAGIGVAGVLLVRALNWRRFFSSIVLFAKQKPQWFYSAFFLLTFQIGTLFDSLRALGALVSAFI